MFDILLIFSLVFLALIVGFFIGRCSRNFLSIINRYDDNDDNDEVNNLKSIINNLTQSA